MSKWEPYIETTYTNIDKTESINLVIPRFVNLSRPVYTLGIWCSGGADSSALLYLLAKTLQEKQSYMVIQPMSVRRQRPWNPVKATHVINKITEILNFKNMLTKFFVRISFENSLLSNRMFSFLFKFL